MVAKSLAHSLNGSANEYGAVTNIRTGRLIEIILDETDKIVAMEQATKMAEKLLAHHITEDFKITIED